MALIIDPDNITYEINDTVSGTVMLTYRPTTQEVKLTEVGALTSDGVTVQALYSKFKDIWLADDLPYDFPMNSIFDESFEFINGARPQDDATRHLLRSAGLAERDSGGTIVREYMCVNSLGSFGAAEQAYYSNQAGVSTDFVYTGPVNELVQIYGGPSDGNFDRRGVFDAYLRIQGKTHGYYDLITEQNITALTYRRYGVVLSNSNDTKITETDNDIDTTSPFTGMSVTYFATAQTTDGVDLPDVLAGGQYDFGVVIDANGGTKEQVYNWFQRQLRKATDIDADADTLIGKLAADALQFVGDTLYTRSTTNPDGGGTGVFIDNIHADSVNSTFFTDNTGTPRNYPFLATGTLEFNDVVQADADAEYRMFFKTLPGAGNDYGEPGAVTTEDSTDTPITGLVSGQASIPWTFNFDTNAQGGRTPGTEATVVVTCGGKNGSKFVKREHTITRSSGQTIPLIAELERSYLNPA